MNSILDNRLIFSNEKKYRIGRHLLVWTVYSIYFGFLHALSPFGSPEIMYFINLPYTLTERFLHLLQHLLIVYPILYFILSRYFLKKKYLVGLILTVIKNYPLGNCTATIS